MLDLHYAVIQLELSQITHREVNKQYQKLACIMREAQDREDINASLDRIFERDVLPQFVPHLPAPVAVQPFLHRAEFIQTQSVLPEPPARIEATRSLNFDTLRESLGTSGAAERNAEDRGEGEVEK